MKHTLCTFMLLSMLFFGCRKAEQNTVAVKEEVYKIENGIVAFKSFKAYSSFLENSSQRDLDNFITYTKRAENYKSIAETTLKETISTRLVLGSNAVANEKIQDLLSDTFLSSMINSDGLVQIGQYLF